MGFFRVICLLVCSISLLAETLNDDLPLSSASYLGGSQADSLVGVAFGPSGDLFVAANFSSDYLPTGATYIPLNGQGAGCLLRLTGDGREALALTRFDGDIVAFAASAFGFAIALEQSMLLLTPFGDQLATDTINFAAKRIDISADGHLVALSAQNEIRLYAPDGQLLAAQTFSQFTRLDDVAITPQGNIVFTGFNQLNANLKSPVLECYDPTLGNRIWKAYGFTDSQVTGANLGADSEGERVAIGADSMLYFGAATDGGNTVLQRQPSDISTALTSGSNPAQATLIQTDNFNRPVGLSGAAKFSFHARFDPANGNIQKAQFLLARLSSGSQNTIRIRDLTADAAGNVLIVGRAFADIEGRDQRTINGQAVGNYAGGNMFALIIEAAYRDRIYWTSFNGNNPGQSEGFAVAAQGDSSSISGRFAFVGDVFADANSQGMITNDPFQPTPGGDREGYLAVQALTFETLVLQWPNLINVRDLINLIGTASQAITISP